MTGWWQFDYISAKAVIVSFLKWSIKLRCHLLSLEPKYVKDIKNYDHVAGNINT